MYVCVIVRGKIVIIKWNKGTIENYERHINEIIRQVLKWIEVRPIESNWWPDDLTKFKKQYPTTKESKLVVTCFHNYQNDNLLNTAIGRNILHYKNFWLVSTWHSPKFVFKIFLHAFHSLTSRKQHTYNNFLFPLLPPHKHNTFQKC